MLEAFDAILDDYGEETPEQLLVDLATIQDSLDELPDFLYCLGEIAHLPRELFGDAHERQGLRTL